MPFSPGSQNNPGSKHYFPTPVIKPGSVIHSYSNQAGKIKRTIILATTDDGVLALTAYFNTTKPFKHIKHLAALQFHLKAEGNKFLEYDSYVNCAHPEVKQMEEIRDAVKRKPSIYLSDLDKKKLDKIRTTVMNSPTVSRRIVKQFGLQDYLLK